MTKKKQRIKREDQSGYLLIFVLFSIFRGYLFIFSLLLDYHYSSSIFSSLVGFLQTKNIFLDFIIFLPQLTPQLLNQIAFVIIFFRSVYSKVLFYPTPETLNVLRCEDMLIKK